MDKFEEKVSDLFASWGDHRLMVLATCENNIVMARTVSVVIFDNRFYFQTDTRMEKAKQIAVNSNVAVSFDNVQIEGVCNVLGHPLDSANKKFISHYRIAYENAYNKYSKLEFESVYEIVPVRIKIWRYSNGNPGVQYYDFSKKIIKEGSYEFGKIL